jgi:hypothetical protein
MSKSVIDRYAARVGYGESELEAFREEGHRVRHVERLTEAAPLYSIVAEVVDSKQCNSGQVKGQRIILDVDGSLITKLCPKRLCGYLVSQLSIPVALINERLSEGHDPNHFHFMRVVRCPDAGVTCLGYGEVLVKVSVVPRIR